MLREILPFKLHDKSEELVEKYVELLYFIIIGFEHGKQRIALAEYWYKKEPNKENYKKLNTARNVLLDRLHLRYTSKVDPLLDELEELGMIRTIPPRSKKTKSRLIGLSEEISEQHHAIIRAYRGVYPKRPLHIITDNAINLLDSMKNLRIRSREILRAANTENDHGWAFYVPKWFNEALDIKLIDQLWNTVSRLVWSQGNSFSFKQGDILYETKYDYEIGNARLQVISGESAEGVDRIDVDEENIEENSIKERFAGFVKYRDFADKSEKTMSQDVFVRMLIEGEKRIVEERQMVLF